jgi:hypothetical protein
MVVMTARPGSQLASASLFRRSLTVQFIVLTRLAILAISTRVATGKCLAQSGLTILICRQFAMKRRM